MEEKEFRRTDGSCVISEEVISSMPVLLPWRFQGWPAWRSARRISAALSVRRRPGRCRVLNNDSETVLDVYINLKQGARIPDVLARCSAA